MTTTPASDSATTVPGSPEPEAVAPTADYGVLRWLVAATFIVILNETIMVNAIPRLMVQFDINAGTAQWLTSAFMLTMAVVIPITGWFLHRVTTRQAFGLAMTVFCTGTLIAALAPSFEVLLVARVVQATGTAVMMPLLMTTLMTIVAESDRGRIMGNVTLAMSVAPALGPAVSGVILDLGSWRWMFGAVLPVAALIAAVGLRYLTNVGEKMNAAVDWISVLLAAAGFGPLVYGLSEIGDATTRTWILLAVGVASIVLFVWRQIVLQDEREPLLDLRALKHHPFALGLGMMSIAFMAMLGSMILLPMYLQEARDLSVLHTGLLMMPGGLAMGLLGPQVGKLYDAYGGRPLIIPGSVGILASLTLFTQVGADTSVWAILGFHMLLMVSLAALFTPVFTISLGALPPHLYSHGSSMLGTLQQVSAAAGTAVVVSVMSSRTASLLADGRSALDAQVGGMAWGFGVGAVLAIGICAAAVFMPGKVEGAEGMHGPH